MNATELKDTRITLEATQSELAAALHVTARQVINWERGKHPVPFLVEHFINQMIVRKLNDIR